MKKRLRYSIIVVMEKENIIIKIRNKFNISQEELAHVLGVSYTSVNAWEGGKRIPQDHMLTVLNDILHSDELPSLGINLKSSKGLLRTDAGYVSSIIDYNNIRDQFPYTHNIGRWYGSLPSFLVRDLLNFARTDFRNNGPVLANFSGSGTVALEAAIAGMKGFATDVNPMAIALSRLKTRPLRISSENFKDAFNKIISNKQVSQSNNANSKSNLILNENRWLSSETRLALKELCTGISLIEDYNLQCIFSVALASIITNYCNIDKRCTNHYVFRENSPFKRQCLEQDLWNEAFSYQKDIHTLNYIPNYQIPDIKFGNTCSLPFEDNTMGIVLSHPPYGTTINYYSISRMPMSVLELIQFKDDAPIHTIDECKTNDISSSTLSKFNSFTKLWINEVYRVLKPGGIFISIIGDSRDNGKLSHPFTDIISHGEYSGFIMKELFIWITNHKSGMHVKRKGNHIDHNYVIIMEKKNEPHNTNKRKY